MAVGIEGEGKGMAMGMAHEQSSECASRVWKRVLLLRLDPSPRPSPLPKERGRILLRRSTFAYRHFADPLNTAKNPTYPLIHQSTNPSTLTCFRSALVAAKLSERIAHAVTFMLDDSLLRIRCATAFTASSMGKIGLAMRSFAPTRILLARLSKSPCEVT